MELVNLSGQLLLQAKMEGEVDPLLDEIARLDKDELVLALDTNEKRLAFWINIYNAFLQIKLQRTPNALNSKIRLFMGKYFTVAGKKLSLEEIEHDLLRRGTFKLSFGYIRDPFLSSYKKELMVFVLDPRIHFALNCGAKSCPPIRFYEAARIEEQLELAAKSYLSQDVQYNAVKKTAKVTPLMSWFRGDFGGKSGIRQLLLKYQLIPTEDVRLRFSKYQWDPHLNNYAETS